MSHSKLDSWQTGNQGILTLRGTEDVISGCRRQIRQQRDIGTGTCYLCGCCHDQHPRSSKIRWGRFGSGQRLRGHDVQQSRLWGSQQVNQQLECIFSCCWAVRRTLVRIACARAPFSVRLPPQFFRITTKRRITRSAKLLVASTKPGQYKKVNKYGRSCRKCLANRRFADSRYLRSSKRSSLTSSRPVAVHNPCSEIFCSR